MVQVGVFPAPAAAHHEDGSYLKCGSYPSFWGVDGLGVAFEGVTSQVWDPPNHTQQEWRDIQVLGVLWGMQAWNDSPGSEVPDFNVVGWGSYQVDLRVVWHDDGDPWNLSSYMAGGTDPGCGWLHDPEIHIDTSWVLGGEGTIAAHELGHSLGLAHDYDGGTVPAPERNVPLPPGWPNWDCKTYHYPNMFAWPWNNFDHCGVAVPTNEDEAGANVFW